MPAERALLVRRRRRRRLEISGAGLRRPGDRLGHAVIEGQRRLVMFGGGGGGGATAAATAAAGASRGGHVSCLYWWCLAAAAAAAESPGRINLMFLLLNVLAFLAKTKSWCQLCLVIK